MRKPTLVNVVTIRRKKKLHDSKTNHAASRSNSENSDNGSEGTLDEKPVRKERKMAREKKRRNLINIKYQELCKLLQLPEGRRNGRSSCRVEKTVILQEAIQELERLLQQNSKLKIHENIPASSSFETCTSVPLSTTMPAPLHVVTTAARVTKKDASGERGKEKRKKRRVKKRFRILDASKPPSPSEGCPRRRRRNSMPPLGVVGEDEGPTTTQHTASLSSTLDTPLTTPLRSDSASSYYSASSPSLPSSFISSPTLSDEGSRSSSLWSCLSVTSSASSSSASSITHLTRHWSHDSSVSSLSNVSNPSFSMSPSGPLLENDSRTKSDRSYSSYSDPDDYDDDDYDYQVDCELGLENEDGSITLVDVGHLAQLERLEGLELSLSRLDNLAGLSELDPLDRLDHLAHLAQLETGDDQWASPASPLPPISLHERRGALALGGCGQGEVEKPVSSMPGSHGRRGGVDGRMRHSAINNNSLEGLRALQSLDIALYPRPVVVDVDEDDVLGLDLNMGNSSLAQSGFTRPSALLPNLPNKPPSASSISVLVGRLSISSNLNMDHELDSRNSANMDTRASPPSPSSPLSPLSPFTTDGFESCVDNLPASAYPARRGAVTADTANSADAAPSDERQRGRTQ